MNVNYVSKFNSQFCLICREKKVFVIFETLKRKNNGTVKSRREIPFVFDPLEILDKKNSWARAQIAYKKLADVSFKNEEKYVRECERVKGRYCARARVCVCERERERHL